MLFRSMAGAKAYHKAPIMIAQDVVAKLEGSGCFCDVQAVNPGFINLKLDERFVADYLDEMETDEDLGLNKTDNPKMIVIDYGGPNVAKPLHVGHLRSAIIGESVKRIARKMRQDGGQVAELLQVVGEQAYEKRQIHFLRLFTFRQIF